MITHGNAGVAELALTFDDGPSIYTGSILHILQQYQIKATFFSIGVFIEHFNEIVFRQYREGHLLGNHTWSHPSLPTLVQKQDIEQELLRCSEALARIAGTQPTFFRPPYGEYDDRTLSCAQQAGMVTVLWDVDPRDWERPGATAISQYSLNAVRNGSILLLHDGGGDRSQTVEALPHIIETALLQGFRFVTLDRLTGEQTSPEPW